MLLFQKIKNKNEAKQIVHRKLFAIKNNHFFSGNTIIFEGAV